MANKVTITTPGPTGPSGLTWKNQWAASTSYAFRDVVRYAVNGNSYFCTVAHTSGTILPTNISYWNVFVDNTDSHGWATTAQHTLFTDSTGTAEYSSKHYATQAKDWASLTTDAVRNDANNADVDYSAKAWAIGGTEVTNTASRGAAKEWATKTTGAVDTADHSAKAWSIGGTGVTTTASKGASKEWATKVNGAVDTSGHSSKAWAVGGTGVTTTASKGASKEWATKTDGAVDTSDHSSKAWAIGGTGVTDTSSKGASKEWAIETSGTVDGTSYSSKEYAQGTQASTGGSAKDYAQKTDGGVSGATSDHSAKAWAVGGTGVTTTSAKGAAKEWATTTGGQVDTSEYSSKEWAIGTTVPSGSSKEWATVTGSAIASSEYSAKEYAQGTAATGGSAKEWAQDTSAAVDTTFSAKEYAQGTQSGTGGSAKNWAQQTGADVTGASSGDMSSKEWAIGTLGRGVANEGSSKDWATYTSGTVDNAGYSALYHANAASQSALSAKNSAAAVANVYDNFSDTFLGSMADNATASSGSANGTWAVNSSSITLASTSGTIEVGQEVTGSGIPTDANVLTVDGSTITISENMAAAGSSVALTFTGQGVYGAFNGSKDGPGTDNDGDALATGALYFNTTDNAMRIYDGANWIAASAAGSASILIYKYLASGGQQTFSGTDANGASLSYTTNNILVFLNGVKLDATDFTATSGTSVVLGSGATASDEIVIVSFKSFTTADMVPASTGGTFTGNVIFNSDIQINGGDIKDANGNESIKIVSTGSAVNELTLTNSATGNAPSISATGTDTNIDLTLSPKGSGEVNISKVDIDAGTIDGATIATSNITVGSGKTLNVSAGTFTASTAQQESIVQTGLPVGMISPFGIASVPTGWLYCDGGTLGNASSGATNANDAYEALFDLIKTIWGNSGGTFSSGNTINLPDLRGAWLRGIGTAGVSGDYVGPTNVGDHQNDQNASHTHTGSSNTTGDHGHSGSTNSTGSHTHSYTTSSTWQTGGGRVWYSDSRGSGGYTTGPSGTHSHTVSISNAGNHSHTLTINADGSTEARVYNRGVKYFIKF